MVFRWQRSLLLALPAAVAVLLLVAACDSGEDQAKRRQATRSLVDAIGLEPEPGKNAIRIDKISSELDAPYYSARGTLPGDRAAVVALVERTLREQGWDVFESMAVDYSLGWRVRAVRGSTVTQVLVGWSDVPAGAFNPFPRQPGRVWVGIQVGRKGSNQLWTHVD